MERASWGFAGASDGSVGGVLMVVASYGLAYTGACGADASEPGDFMDIFEVDTPPRLATSCEYGHAHVWEKGSRLQLRQHP